MSRRSGSTQHVVDVKKLKSKVVAARNRFERGKVPPLLLACIYHDYNPVEDACRFVGMGREMFPRLNCGLASSYLQVTLGAGTVVNGSYCGQGHTFLYFDDNLIIDITADQFGGPRVYVGPLKSPWSITPASKSHARAQMPAEA